MSKIQTPFIKRLLRSKVLIVAEVLVLVFFTTALVKEIVRKYSVEKEISQLQQELTELEQQNIELSSLVEYFDSDTFKEEQARLKLGLQKPGESVVAVLGDSVDLDEFNSGSTNKLALNNSNENISNPQRWWRYFFSTQTEKIN